MEVCVSVCVRELVCVVVFACYVCMCLVSRAFTEPLESSERHTHTLMQLHTDIQKHTDICRCKRAHAFWARARTGPF